MLELGYNDMMHDKATKFNVEEVREQRREEIRRGEDSTCDITYE